MVYRMGAVVWQEEEKIFISVKMVVGKDVISVDLILMVKQGIVLSML